MSYLDDNIGKLVAALEETGLAAKTRILYTSDHGESMGQKGMMSKCNMYDESVGVPMILAGAGVPRGNAVDTPAQLLDVFPTILEATGTEPTDEDRALPGTSLFDLAERCGRPRRGIFSEQHSGGAKSAVYMLRRNGHKYVRYMEDYPPQLFDLANDPRELDDLAGDPAHAGTRGGLRGGAPRPPRPRGGRREGEGRPVAERIERGGGQEAIVAQGSLGYTPAPGEAPQYMT